jgi:non-heme chloroperoxidase
VKAALHHAAALTGIGTLLVGCVTGDSNEPLQQNAQTLMSKNTINLSTGIVMAYQELGDPAGKPVIFLHGFTDTSRSFAPTVDALLDSDPRLHVFVLDQRGHGDSSMPPASSCAAAPEQCFRPNDMAEDAIAFMDQKGIAKATIVGHSMGSFVAQEIGLSHPHRAERLVLIGTSANITGNVVLNDYLIAEPIEGSWKSGFEAQGYIFPNDVYSLTPIDANADALGWIAGGWVTDPTADPAFIAQIVPETSAVKMGAWIGAARALATIDNRTRLQQLAVDTLVIWATQDAFFYETDQAELRASLDVSVAACRMSYSFKQYGKRPLSELGIQTDDLGHNTQWGSPAAIAQDIASFIRHDKPTKTWFYSSETNPQNIVEQNGKAPIIANKSNQACP